MKGPGKEAHRDMEMNLLERVTTKPVVGKLRENSCPVLRSVSVCVCGSFRRAWALCHSTHSVAQAACMNSFITVPVTRVSR